MKLNKFNHVNCPQCQKSMKIKSLGCDECELTVKGHFSSHPLIHLDEEMQHFLHVFINCEGKIADMEKALNISYPTVKNKLQKLKELVNPTIDIKAEKIDLKNMSSIEILDLIDKGQIDYKTGLKIIKELTEK